MEKEVTFNSNLSVTKDLSYENGDGFYHSLSFYIKDIQHETSINKKYLFVSYTNGIKEESNISVDKYNKEVTAPVSPKFIGSDRNKNEINELIVPSFLGSNRDKNEIEYLSNSQWLTKANSVKVNNEYAMTNRTDKGIEKLKTSKSLYNNRTYNNKINLEQFYAFYGKENNRIMTDDTTIRLAILSFPIQFSNDNIIAEIDNRSLSIEKESDKLLSKTYPDIIIAEVFRLQTSKAYRSTKLDYYEDHVWFLKGMDNGYIDDTYTIIEKKRADAGIDDYILNADKKIRDGMLEYTSPWISKESYKSSFNYNDVGFDKSSYIMDVKYNQEFISKNSKRVNDDIGNMLISKSPNRVVTDASIILIDKSPYSTMLNESIKSLYKLPKDTYYAKDDKTFHIDKGSREINIKEVYKLLKRPDNELYINNIFKSLFRDALGMYDSKDNLFTHKESYEIQTNKAAESSLAPHLTNFQLDEKVKWVDMKQKDTHMDYDDHMYTVMHYDGDWKPELVDSGLIDELILPHKDFDYNKYIAKLLDVDGNINMTYVTGYDSVTETYTVSIPVENPIDLYADKGREYLDLDVNVLDILIYILRTIWKDNMYKYIAMSALDSIKHIITQIDVLLAKYYTLNEFQRKEFDRAMQLFRWYSEMAILNNCDYLLKFDTTSNKVNFADRSLGELGNMVELDNMHIGNNYVLEPIDSTKSASITFVNLKKDFDTKPTLNFTLYNINHGCSISIIDDINTITKTYDEGMFEISEQLKDKIKINFTPYDSTHNIAIANVLVTNIRTNSFTVTYKGRFGEINQVMQNMLDQMLVVGAVSADLRDKLSDVSPVTTAVSTIMKYFEYHHKEKLKGKRLITKK